MTAADLRSSPVADRIRAERLVVVLRGGDTAALVDLVAGLAEAGAAVFEITMDRTDGPAAIAACRAALPAGCLVGAGTVRSAEQLEAAIGAGAAFGVSPVLDLDVLTTALRGDLPFVPGAYTPTEADVAWRAGATFVKLFPASSLGATHVRELRGPLGEIEVIPTGGIDADNAADFLAAGAVAVGVGSALARADATGRAAVLRAVRDGR